MTTFNAEGYDVNGWAENGLHEGGGYFHPDTRRTKDGGRHDPEGYDAEGLAADGFDREGYGSDGYDVDGEDAHGFSRCERGECDDPDCRDCHSTDDELVSSDTDGIEALHEAI